MAEAKFLRPDTLALHAGQHPDPVTGARINELLDRVYTAPADLAQRVRDLVQ